MARRPIAGWTDWEDTISARLTSKPAQQRRSPGFPDCPGLLVEGCKSRKQQLSRHHAEIRPG